MTRTGFDVSDPSGPKPGFDVAAGYVGGQTPHIWTPHQWVEQPARWRLPFWVVDFTVPPEQAADDFIAELDVLGWPLHVAVCWDLEANKATPPDVAWYNKACDRMHAAHRLNIGYGSVSTLFGYPPRAGYLVADWTGQPHMYEHPYAVGTQWTDKGSSGGQTVDLDEFLDQAALPLWDTQPPAVQAPDEAWEPAALAQARSVAVEATALAAFIGAHTP